jgi:hypothetical protein
LGIVLQPLHSTGLWGLLHLVRLVYKQSACELLFPYIHRCTFRVYPAIHWKQCRSPTFFPLTPKLGKPTVSLSNSSSMTRLCFTQGSPCRHFSPVEEERPEPGNKLGRSRSILSYSRFRLLAPILNPFLRRVYSITLG